MEADRPDSVYFCVYVRPAISHSTCETCTSIKQKNSMKRVQGKHVLIVVIAMVLAAAVYGWSIIQRGFSAREEPSRVEAFLARRLRRLATPAAAREAKNPVQSTPAVLSGAMAHYADHCATCHGNDGKGETLIGRGLYPKPPDMTAADTQQLTDGEVYYIIENGIRFTGMPAFGEDP